MKTVRLGIIGLGNIGRFHAKTVMAGKVARCELKAVASRKPEARDEFPTLPFFQEPEALMRSGLWMPCSWRHRIGNIHRSECRRSQRVYM
jgi:predicted dehydrogenase